ncbi:MAG: DUF481 domain-containing protein [Planctomycetota bacterium]|nr:DUF481 domain-containing protein [Planctomycetota bacterium]
MRRRLFAPRLLAAGFLIIGASAATASARPIEAAALTPGDDHLLTLDNGDVIKVRVISVTPETALVEHPVFGQMSVPLARVSAAAPAPSPAQVEAAAAKAKEEAAAALEVPPPVQEEAKLSFFEGWKGSLAAGVNGSDGNSETFSGRIQFNANRLTDLNETRWDNSYLYATDNGEKSKNRFESVLRHDFLFKDSPWGFFVQGKAEFDEFQDWNWRASLFAGPSYALIKNDSTTLRLRAGAGITREFGGDSNDIVPEALFGFDFNHKFDDKQSLFFNYEYLPSLKNFSDYRMTAKAGYEILLDKKSNLSLRLGVEDRYDSEPGPDSKKNDVEYFALIAWAF